MEKGLPVGRQRAKLPLPWEVAAALANGTPSEAMAEIAAPPTAMQDKRSTACEENEVPVAQVAVIGFTAMDSQLVSSWM